MDDEYFSLSQRLLDINDVKFCCDNCLELTMNICDVKFGDDGRLEWTMTIVIVTTFLMYMISKIQTWRQTYKTFVECI